MTESYLNILKDSLEKKLDVLRKIQEVSCAQKELLKAEVLDIEGFDRTVDEKDSYIKELTILDEGFDTLYEKIRQELMENRQKYAAEIKQLQQLISEITDKSTAIQAQESRNKAMLETYFKKERQSIGSVRRSSKAAYGYYQSMSGKHVEQRHFMDQKK